MKILQITGVIFILLFLSVDGHAQSIAYNHSAKHLSASRNDKQELTVNFDKKAGTPLLNPPHISAVMNDANDPAMIKGITITIAQNGQSLSAADFTISAESNNEMIVSKDSIIITKSNGKATFQIHPSAAGYADINVRVSAAGLSKTIGVNYAVSLNDARNQQIGRAHV